MAITDKIFCNILILFNYIDYNQTVAVGKRGKKDEMIERNVK